MSILKIAFRHLKVMSFMLLWISFTQAAVADEKDIDKWLVNYEKSRMEFEIRQSNQRRSGYFTRWDATIKFDPLMLEQSSINASAESLSVVYGSFSDQLRSPAFLNAFAHPNIAFISKSIVEVGKNEYRAIGELTLMGEKSAAELDFSITIENDHATAIGTFTIDRRAFGIGIESYSDDILIGFPVDIKIKIIADRLVN